MSKDKMDSALEAFIEALDEVRDSSSFLDEIKKNEDRERGIATDALIKRFEVAFEYAWKLMKAAAEYQGSEAFGPRPAIQEAVRYGWIEDPEFWAEALDARNGSVHDYFGVTIDQYLSIIKKFVRQSDAMVKRLRGL